jgi:chaperonin GroES
MRLLKDRILVRPKGVQEKTESGFIIPEEAKKAPSSGEIVAVGDTSVLKVGEFVQYADGAGTDIDHEKEWLLVMKDADVLLVI